MIQLDLTDDNIRTAVENRYAVGRKLLENIVDNVRPSPNILAYLYDDMADVIGDQIQEFQEKFKVPGTKRDINREIPSEIDETMLKATRLPDNIQIMKYLCASEPQVPTVESLKNLYGVFAESAHILMKTFIDLKMKRKDGTAISIHHQGVAQTVALLFVSDVYKKYGFEYMQHLTSHQLKEMQRHAAEALFHDAIEELMNNIRNEDGSIKYGLQNYPQFLDDYIPKELQKGVILLTNHYDMIINYARNELKRRKKAVTRENLQSFLKELHKGKPSRLWKKEFSHLEKYITEISEVLETVKDDELGAVLKDQSFDDRLKMYCYNNLYMPNLISECHKSKNYRAKAKKDVDLIYNGSTLDPSDLTGRVKSVLKRFNAVEIIRQYNGEITFKPVKNHTLELERDTYQHACHMIVTDLLNWRDPQRSMAAALVKFKLFQPVFYNLNSRTDHSNTGTVEGSQALSA